MEKKILKYIYGAFMLPILFAAASCSSETDTPSQPTDPSLGEKITFEVSMAKDNNSNTRVSYHDDKVESQQNTLLWEAGDKLKVVAKVGSEYKEEIFTLTSGANTKVAQFSGKRIPGATSYKVYYPSTVKINKKNGSATLDMGKQMQNGDNNTDHLKNLIFLEGERTSPAHSITMTMKSSIMKLNIINEYNPVNMGNLKKLFFVVGNRPTDDSKTVTYRYMQQLEFKKNSVKIDKSNQELTAYFSFIPGSTIGTLDLQKEDVVHVILLGDNDKKYQCVLSIHSPVTYAAGKRYTAIVDNFYKFRSPLEYAAERNLAPDGKSFPKTDANNVSGYFTRTEAENLFTGTPKKITISSTDYIYPDNKQWFSIIPESSGINDDIMLAFTKGYMHKDREEDVKVGKLHIKTKNDYIQNSNLNTVYALRFKGWPDLWRTAWRYKIEKDLVPYTKKTTRTTPRYNYCLVIETIYLGPFDKTTVEQIAKPEFWENKTTVKRIFPFSGSTFKGASQIPDMGECSYWWVNTPKYDVYVHRENGYTINDPKWNLDGQSMVCVRPFYLDIFK